MRVSTDESDGLAVELWGAASTRGTQPATSSAAVQTTHPVNLFMNCFSF
jgi:hypothetical protein